MQCYLASTSPARLALLRSAGIEPVLLASGVDEPAAVAAATESLGPRTTTQTVALLAQAKAEAVLGTTPYGEALHGIVFGGDSALELDGVTLGKPHTPARASERWRAQRGRTAVLHSGHWAIRVEHGTAIAARGAVVSTTVHFAADISDTEIDAYVATGEPLEVAGAFTIDAKGAAYIDRIEGDASAVVGFSIPTARRLSTELGIPWHELWNH